MRETIGHSGKVYSWRGGAVAPGWASRTWASRTWAGAAVLALVCLACVLLAARPAHAQETWYGTVEYFSDGVPVTEDHGAYKTVTTEKHYVSYEAPLSADRATVSGKYYKHIKYEYSSPPPPNTGCYATSYKLEGSWRGTGSIKVYLPNSIVTYDNTQTFDGIETVRYTGTSADGTSCPGTTVHENVDTYTFWQPSIQNTMSPVGSCQGDCVQGIGQFEGRTNARWGLSSVPFGTYANVHNIGNNDKVSVFTVAQTQSLNARLSAFDDNYGKPAVCDWSFVKRLNKLCTAYKAVTQIEWMAARTMMGYAAQEKACGLWIEDGASWRPPKIRSAKDPQFGQNIAYIKPGQTQLIKTATGTMTLTCPG